MEEWKIGDIAICINNGDITGVRGHNPPLRIYKEYIVNDINICSCGSVALDVGLTSVRPDQETNCNCRKKIPGVSIHWCNATRFVKKQSKQMVQMELNAAVEAEDYELANVINERLKSM